MIGRRPFLEVFFKGYGYLGVRVLIIGMGPNLEAGAALVTMSKVVGRGGGVVHGHENNVFGDTEYRVLDIKKFIQ